MCPACLAIAALTVTGAASAGGISVLAYKTFRKSKKKSQMNKTRKDEHVQP